MHCAARRVPSPEESPMRSPPHESKPGELIRELRQTIGLRDEDCVRLRDLSRHYAARRGQLSQQFYALLHRNDAIAAVFERSGTAISRLRETWEQWAEELFEGVYDASYEQRRLTIGAVHLHIGVEEHYTVAAFHLARQFFTEMIHNAYREDDAAQPAMVQSLNRVLDLDLALISYAYDRELEAETVAEQSKKRKSLEDLLGGLLATPSLLVLSIDHEGRILDLNSGCEQLLETSKAEAIGQEYAELFVFPDDRERVREAQQAIVRNWHTENSSPPPIPAHRLVVRERGECSVTWYPTSIPAEPGRPHAFLWVGHDTTEEQRLQSQIIHQEKMAAVGLLAAGVAHEIGNPLASISSVAQTLLRKSDDEYLRGKLDLVRTHIDRIANIVHRMVDFARPPRNEWRLCSINDLVRNAAQILEYDKRAKNVTFELLLAEDLPKTIGMDDQLTQVFLNIVLNALDAVEGNPDDQPAQLQIETRLEFRGEGSTILFRCCDNGPGMPADKARRVFEPFYTTKEVGRGTGLGLSVSFRIVSEHGGRISVESEPGEGACFEIRIPVRTQPPKESE